MKMMFMNLCLCTLLHVITASILPIESVGNLPAFEHIEKMYATNNGPFGGKEGKSFVHINVTGVNLEDYMEDWTMVTLFTVTDTYTNFLENGYDIAYEICAPGDTVTKTGIVQSLRVEDIITNATLHINRTFNVTEYGWTATQVFVCTRHGGYAPVAFSGTLAVKNPYGYLPSMYYGLFFFSKLSVVAYATLDIIFLIQFFRYYAFASVLQRWITAVLLVGTTSSVLWLITYNDMNETGGYHTQYYYVPILVEVRIV